MADPSSVKGAGMRSLLRTAELGDPKVGLGGHCWRLLLLKVSRPGMLGGGLGARSES